jgi:hypothetical protein
MSSKINPFTAYCLLFTAYCLPFTAYCLPFTVSKIPSLLNPDVILLLRRGYLFGEGK